MKSFITGSHAYGTPTEDSDVDLVVFLEKFDAQVLVDHAIEICDTESEMTKEYGIPDKAGKSNLRVGKLNLICVYSEDEYNLWKQATDDLKKMAPVTRDFAVDYIHKMRMELWEKKRLNSTENTVQKS